MKKEITWKTVYDIWMEYVSKLQINLEVNIVNVEVDIDTNGIEVDWISKEVYDAVQNQKNKERLKLNKTTTNGVQQTIKCIREAQNNFEHLSFLWIRAFLHEVKRKKKFQTAEETILIQKLDAIIKQQQNKFKIAEYQNNMDSVLPGYLFSQVLVNEVHIVKLENFIEMCALNTLYITNQYYFVRYIKKSEISEQQKELFQSIAEYWHIHGNLEHTSVTYEDATERCWCCGMNKKLYPSYIIPKELKGEYKPNNLILLCGTCKRSAPQVYNPYSMWQWLQGHKIRFFDHYRIEEAAKEYLAAAVANGFDAEKTYTIYCSGDSLETNAIQAFMSQWKNVLGLNFEMNIMDNATLTSKLNEGTGEIPFVVSSTNAAAGDPDHGLFVYKGTTCTTHNDPELFALINEAAAEFDTEKRIELYGQVQDMLHEGCYTIPMVNTNAIYGLNANVQGLKTDPGYVPDLTGVYFE